MSEQAIRDTIKTVVANERIHYKPANVLVNAPLALEQQALESKCRILHDVLMTTCRFKCTECPEIPIYKRCHGCGNKIDKAKYLYVVP
jgi:hypothetical protein